VQHIRVENTPFTEQYPPVGRQAAAVVAAAVVAAAVVADEDVQTPI